VLDEGPVPALEATGEPLHARQHLELRGQGVAAILREIVGLVALGLAAEQPFPADPVGGGVQQEALRLEPVAAGAAGLLIVRLERPRNAVMHHEAHVRSIDAHAECVRRDHHRVRITQVRVLHQ